MNFRPPLLPASLLAGCLVALLGYAEWTNWNEVTRLRQRLGEIELESDAAEFQTRLLTLHGTLLVRAAGSADSTARRNHAEDGARLADWLRAQSALLATVDTPAENTLLARLGAQYESYRLAARPFLADDSDITHASVALGVLNAALTPLLGTVEAWKAMHHTSLEADISAVAGSLRVLHALLLTSFFLLAAVVAFAGYLIHRGLIAPLRRELVASHALLARQEKLASLGVLAAGVAHEIRNPLTAIKARLFSQQKRLAAGSPEQDDAQVIGGEIGRLERIVRETLQFARPDAPILEDRLAEDFLHEIREFMAPVLNKDVNVLKIDTGEQPTPVQIDSAQMKQVFINLVQNAADSAGQNGHITLRIRPAFLPLASRRTDAVALEVEDDGPGIPAEVQARLFDPFFTTKAGGTGLGLAIAARITQSHGGVLQYRTPSGRGATFSVVLPAAGAADPLLSRTAGAAPIAS